MTFQQRVLLGASGVLQTQQAAVGPEGVQGAEVHQLWAALPDLGSYFVKVSSSGLPQRNCSVTLVCCVIAFCPSEPEAAVCNSPALHVAFSY